MEHESIWLYGSGSCLPYNILLLSGKWVCFLLGVLDIMKTTGSVY